MRNLIRRALTRTMRVKKREMKLPPSEHIVWMVYFATVCLIVLIALEVIYMVYFRSWNSEVFSAITALIGTITGVFLTQKA